MQAAGTLWFAQPDALKVIQEINGYFAVTNTALFKNQVMNSYYELLGLHFFFREVLSRH